MSCVLSLHGRRIRTDSVCTIPIERFRLLAGNDGSLYPVTDKSHCVSRVACKPNVRDAKFWTTFVLVLFMCYSCVRCVCIILKT